MSQDERTFIGNVIARIGQMMCGLTGHDEMLRFGRGHLSLHCPLCGYESRGWDLRIRWRRRSEARALGQISFAERRLS